MQMQKMAGVGEEGSTYIYLFFVRNAGMDTSTDQVVCAISLSTAVLSWRAGVSPPSRSNGMILLYIYIYIYIYIIDCHIP